MPFVRRDTRRISRPLLPERGRPNYCGHSRPGEGFVEQGCSHCCRFCGQIWIYYSVALHLISCSDCQLELQHLRKRFPATDLGDLTQVGPYLHFGFPPASDATHFGEDFTRRVSYQDCHAAVQNDVFEANTFPLNSERAPASKAIKIQPPVSPSLPAASCSGLGGRSTGSSTTYPFSEFSRVVHGQLTPECPSSPDSYSPVDDAAKSPEAVLQEIYDNEYTTDEIIGN
jgi:hypothetical protein